MNTKCSECFYFLEIINECDHYKCKMFPGNDSCKNFKLRHGIPKDIHKIADPVFDYKTKNEELKSHIHKLEAENKNLKNEIASLKATEVETKKGQNKVSVSIKYSDEV